MVLILLIKINENESENNGTIVVLKFLLIKNIAKDFSIFSFYN